MNFAKYFTAFLGTLALVACGGSKDVAPVVDPTPAPEAKPAKVTLDSAIDRYSYALGMDLGKAIANVNIPLKMDVLMAAILDETDSTRPVLLNDTAAEAALQDLLLQMQKKKEADEAASAKKALDEQAAFLAKNIMDSTVKTTPKGVQYKVLKDSTGISPKASDKVKVHYIGSLRLAGLAPGDEGRHEGEGLDPERLGLRRSWRSAAYPCEFAARVRSGTAEGLCGNSGFCRRRPGCPR